MHYIVKINRSKILNSIISLLNMSSLWLVYKNSIKRVFDKQWQNILLVDCVSGVRSMNTWLIPPTCHQSLLSSPPPLFLITSVLLPPQRWWGIIPLSSTLCWSKGDRTGDKHNNRMANKYHWKLRHALNTEKRLTFE